MDQKPKAVEVTRKGFLVSDNGGTLDYTREGEVLFSVSVPPGIQPARPYFDLAPPGCEIEVSKGLVAVPRRGGYAVQKYGKGSHESGANPVFRPTIASRFEREMRLTISRMQGTIKAQEARIKSWAGVPRVPRAPAAPPAPPAEPEAPVVE